MKALKPRRIGLLEPPTIVLTVLFLLTLAIMLRPYSKAGGYDWKVFGSLPVVADGRIKPLDSVARQNLLLVHGNENLRINDRSWTAIEWLAEMMIRPDRGENLPVVLVENPEIHGLLGVEGGGRDRFAVAELAGGAMRLLEMSTEFEKKEAVNRSPYEREVVRVARRIMSLAHLRNALRSAHEERPADEMRLLEQVGIPTVAAFHSAETQKPREAARKATDDLIGRFAHVERWSRLLSIPLPGADQDPQAWVNLGTSQLRSLNDGTISPIARAYYRMMDGYYVGNPAAFNSAVSELHKLLREKIPHHTRMAGLEQWYNHSAPLFWSMIFYILATLLAVFSWVKASPWFSRSAFWIIAFTFALHTAGIVLRMIIQERPPVTNLYSSAIFVGWGAVLVCLLIERYTRHGFGSAAAGFIGACTLLVAGGLGAEGDTLEVMRAVLDSNFWLATHVTVITLGYSATFLAGFFGILFVLLAMFTSWMTSERRRSLATVTYGVICFATLLSFVGTILGGIWADQSWGRFWGWDPKENGALMIVIWNAIILHARWGNMIRERGLMVLAVAGNIITAFSWFGVNLMGIGLHSYGFTESGFFWLMVFCAAQLSVIVLGCLPLQHWASFAPSQPSSTPPAPSPFSFPSN